MAQGKFYNQNESITLPEVEHVQRKQWGIGSSCQSLWQQMQVSTPWCQPASVYCDIVQP